MSGAIFVSMHQVFLQVLEQEANAIEVAKNRISKKSVDQLTKAFESLVAFGGNLVFCGVGKSGLIGAKLASTFSSLGLPSWTLHPTEALHGDLGRLTEKDFFVFISKSGTTEEILKLIPFLNTPKEQRFGLLGNPGAEIATHCGFVLDCSVEKEACVNNLAPTTSTTVTLAIGDAMAVVYEQLVGLSKEKYAINHPGGLLGKTLRYQVKHLMVPARDCAIVNERASFQDVLFAMTQKPVNGCAIINDHEEFVGIIVEGDIRRTLVSESSGLETKIEKILNRNPIFVSPETLAFDAISMMESRERPLNLVPVINDKKFFGFLRLHDLLKEGFRPKK